MPDLSRFVMTVGGAAVAGNGEMDVINPATEEVIAQAPVASAEDLDAAVVAAECAFATWRKTSLEKRRQLVEQASCLLEENADWLGELLTLEQGRPIRAAQTEITRAANFMRNPTKIDLPVLVCEDSSERRVETHRVPLGVVAAIAPWNFPINLACWKIGPALVAGNTVVLKPSPFTPLTTLRLGELLAPVFPPGVLNVISGGDDLGPLMTAHPGFSKIAFTGSIATGKKVMRSAADTLKKVTLELGGNDPAIVFPDVDVDKTARQLFWGCFYNSGQMCVATKRIYIHESIYNQFRDAFATLAKRIRIGNGLDPNTNLGPIQNAPQYRRVNALIADAKSSGLNLIEAGSLPARGYFVPLVIADEAPDDSPLVEQEAFGPVVPLLKFVDEDEVVERANRTQFGLAATIWSSDIDRACAVADRIDAGTVWLNENLYTCPDAPFGGHKQSAVGVENGIDGLLEYTQCKTIYCSKK